MTGVAIVLHHCPKGCSSKVLYVGVLVFIEGDDCEVARVCIVRPSKGEVTSARVVLHTSIGHSSDLFI